MNKINSNALPLSSLITKEQFINFFLTYGSGPNTSNIFYDITTNSANVQLASIFYATSSLPSMMYLLSQSFDASRIGFSISFLRYLFLLTISTSQTHKDKKSYPVLENCKFCTFSSIG